MSPGPLADTWTDERAARVGQRVERKLQQRRRLTRAGGALGLGAVAAVLAVALWPSNTLRLAEGSRVTLLDPQTQVTALVDTPAAVNLELVRGRARFEVTKIPERTFRVEVGTLSVVVVGTRFVVEREADGARVTVEEGHVRVLGPERGAEQHLYAGQSGRFAFAPPPAVVEPPPVLVEPAEPEAPAATAAPPRADWRPLANKGEFERAYDMMKKGAVRDEPKELLLASDVARLSGHPELARRYLHQVVDRHARDPRAPLAAFTLGRVLLDELGWPRDAAQAFAKARALDPNGPLAEDALAREVEAWARAGESDQARTAADVYSSKYPNGARALSVRRYSSP